MANDQVTELAAEISTGRGGPDVYYEGPDIVVNSRPIGPVGWGDQNGSLIDLGSETDNNDYDDFVQLVPQQLFQTGHTQNRVTEDSAEYGMGVGPERKRCHYPYVDQPNPYRRHDAYGRWALGDDSRYRQEVVAYWAQAQDYEMLMASSKQRSPVNPIVDQFPSQPFVESLTPGGY